MGAPFLRRAFFAKLTPFTVSLDNTRAAADGKKTAMAATEREKRPLPAIALTSIRGGPRSQGQAAPCGAVTRSASVCLGSGINGAGARNIVNDHHAHIGHRRRDFNPLKLAQNGYHGP